MKAYYDKASVITFLRELMRNDELTTIESLTFEGLTGLQSLKLKRNSISTLKDGAFFGLHSIVNL